MDNFKQAVNELTGSEEQATESKTRDLGVTALRTRASETDVEEYDEDESVFASDDEGVRVVNNLRTEFDAPFSQSLDLAVSKAPASGSNSTVIAPGTVVDGNISSNEDLMIYGVVNGDVLNARKLVIHGEVAGSISAMDISLVDSIIAGNVVAQNSTEMTKDSCILGDLTTQNVVVSGKVKGNIEARGNGIFKKDSIVLGNISVGTIVIEGGAKMRGFVSTTDGDKEVDEDLFPQK
ncbi:MAG: polymer-forming cytoskeletal protein [Clostridiales bacterium]|nr:polymer-forming cytoskeletal protein [Clostridiales bacterium]